MGRPKKRRRRPPPRRDRLPGGGPFEFDRGRADLGGALRAARADLRRRGKPSPFVVLPVVGAAFLALIVVLALIADRL